MRKPCRSQKIFVRQNRLQCSRERALQSYSLICLHLFDFLLPKGLNFRRPAVPLSGKRIRDPGSLVERVCYLHATWRHLIRSLCLRHDDIDCGHKIKISDYLEKKRGILGAR